MPPPPARFTPKEVDPAVQGQLLAFSRAAAADPELQARLRSCRTPADILRCAAQLGYGVSLELLRASAMDLSAPYWPWAEAGQKRRQAFFGS
jgi:hypothetical protein